MDPFDRFLQALQDNWRFSRANVAVDLNPDSGADESEKEGQERGDVGGGDHGGVALPVDDVEDSTVGDEAAVTMVPPEEDKDTNAAAAGNEREGPERSLVNDPEGVLSYLAESAPHLVGVPTGDGWFPVALAMVQGRHSDLDVRTLANVNPAGLCSNLYVEKNALKGVLRCRRWNRGLIQHLFQLSPMCYDQSLRFPGNVLEEDEDDDVRIEGQVVAPVRPVNKNNPLNRLFLDMDCAHGMVPMLLRCVKFHNYCQKWQSNAFIEVMHNLMASPKLREIITCVPNTMEFTSNQQWFRTPQFKSLASRSKVQHLQIWDGVDNACSHSLLKDCALNLQYIL
ncbi:expressed unknown protein [Seminavis robusta]|uniref:Uncharacterized protein n=1 Tax=Seminavis robusta TaxID=568900 RepID=A0A9N8DH50_9STRA|nr:expressed unknown protein [Seminavis robusta]|eukprot:Sro86_g045560.1 n/a (339) ;mRNA; f:3883-5037